jgi:alpha-tubulin suppressor-like RCC1 family protein
MSKPFITTRKRVLAAGAVLLTGASLLIAQNITTVQASDDQEFVSVKQVSAGDTFATIISDDGEVFSRGWNNQGQLGVNAGQDINVDGWTKVAVDEKVTSINSPYDHAVALTESGKIFSWGPNDEGQIGNGTTEAVFTPKQITAAARYEQVASGADFTAALDAQGRLWTWGANAEGQLGDGTTNAHTVPALAKTTNRFSQIFAGKNFAIALTENGEMFSWGANGSGQLGDGTTTPRLEPAPTAGAEQWSTVSVNIQSETVLAVSEDNRLFSWGANPNGELGSGVDWRKQQTDENTRVARQIEGIKADDQRRKQALINQCVATARAEDDTRVASVVVPTPIPVPTPTASPAPNPSASPTATPSPTPTPTPTPTAPPVDYVTPCTAEVNQTFKNTDTSNIKPAVIPEPELKGNSSEPVNLVPNVRFETVALGTQNGYAVDVVDRLYAWGSDANGQTGLNIDDAKTHTQVPVSMFTKVTDVAAGDKFAAATTTDSRLYVWGENSHGELMSDPAKEAKLLTPTRRGDTFISVTAGPNSVYAQTNTTTTQAWGDNSEGRLGTGSAEERVFVPTEMTSKMRSVSLFNTGGVGLNIANQLVAWGKNTNGEFGNGSVGTEPVREVTAKVIDKFSTVKAGYLYSLAVDDNGQTWGWGSGTTNLIGAAAAPGANSYPVALPDLGTNVTELAAGKTVAAAMNENTLFVWGGSQGQETQQLSIEGLKQLDAGDDQVLVLTNDNKVINVAANAEGTFEEDDVTPAPGEFTTISAGNNTSFAVSKDGVLYGWGDNRNGVLQLDGNQKTDVKLNVKNVSINSDYVLIVDNNGVVWGWGYSPYNVFGLTSVKDKPVAVPLTATNEEK